MNFIAIGRTEVLLESVTNLIENGHEILLIITCPSEQYQYSKSEDSFIDYSKKTGVECIITNNINSQDIIKKIKSLNPDIGVSYNWKTLIKKEAIDVFPFGILNCHSGDIPRYKGNAVRNWAIVSGEGKMGLTIHQMTERLDEGPIIIKKFHEINEKTTIKNLYDFVSEQTPKLFLDAVNSLEKGTIDPELPSDNPENHLRCFPRIPIDSEIDWNLSAKEIDRIIRASSEPFSGAYTFLDYKKLIIWEAYVYNPEFNYLTIPGQVVERRLETNEVVVSTDSGFIVIRKLSVFGEDANLKPTEIIKSIRTRLGIINTPIYDLSIRLNEIENQLKMEKGGE